jgi:hypothetical protein
VGSEDLVAADVGVERIDIGLLAESKEGDSGGIGRRLIEAVDRGDEEVEEVGRGEGGGLEGEMELLSDLGAILWFCREVDGEGGRPVVSAFREVMGNACRAEAVLC